MQVSREEELIKHITVFYKNLFGELEISEISLGDIHYSQLSEQDRNFLTKYFGMEEIKEVVFGLKHNKAA